MTATKITTKITDLVENGTTTECNIRVPTSNNFYITQPDANHVMLGVMRQRVYFGGKSEKWVYENFNCLTNTICSMMQPTTNERISMRGGWKTHYFQDMTTGKEIGNAIVAELKSKESEYHSGGESAQEQILSPVAIYYDCQGIKTTLKGSILCPSGTSKSSVAVRYDICAERLNVAVLGTSDFTYYSFAIGEITEAQQLTFADAVYSAEYTMPVMHAEAFSPDGNLLLCVDEAADNETYCKVAVMNKTISDKFADITSHKFQTFNKMFGNNTIKWYPGLIQVKCYTGDLELNLTTGSSKFIEFGVQNVNLVFKKWRTPGYTAYDTCIKINGITWRVPNTKRAQPLKTFVVEEEIFEYTYNGRWNINKSIPASNRSLEWIMLFENDNVAVFKIGCRTIICFDKLLQFQPVIYQIPIKNGLEIVAITRDRIYTQTYEDDEDEYRGGSIIVLTYKYNFVSRLESQLRYNIIPNPPKGYAFSLVGKFLEHQKKD